MNTDKPTIQGNKAEPAMLACGWAAIIFGLLVVIGEANKDFLNSLIWVKSVGPLSGKVGITLVCWVLLWVALDKCYSKQPARENGVIERVCG